MQTFSFQCSEKLAKKLRDESRIRKVPKSELLREALELYLFQKEVISPASIYTRSKDLCGSLHEPEDLSENSKNLR